MADKNRNADRQALVVYFEVLDRENDESLGYLADLSRSGLMFVSAAQFDPSDRLSLRIAIPGSHSTSSHVDADVEVRWTRPNINPDLACVGCRFTGIDEDDLAELIASTRDVSFGPEFDVSRVPRLR